MNTFTGWVKMMEYQKFLENKRIRTHATGFEIPKQKINRKLFDWQSDIVWWALKKGRAAIWSRCGTGKTPMQLEYGYQVHKHTGGDILIVAPLNVSHQTIQEGRKFGYDVNLCRTPADVKPGLNITNYEMVEHFNPDKFIGIILDESSILKSFNGAYRTMLIEMFRNTPYKLSCTATPSPNDYMELGNHAEFTGVMSRNEMLATFFVHDGSDTAKWRLKGHAEKRFWEWIASWAVVLEKPSDLGYSDEGFDLPPLYTHEIIVESEAEAYSLLPKMASTLNERREARRNSLEDRVSKAAELTQSNNDQWIAWCDLNAESESLKKAIPDSVEVRGSDKIEHKINSALGFTNGDIRVLVSKPSIFGFGMNWQNCHNMIFTGLSDSYEEYYQAVRRCWRYGQKEPVNVYLVISESEGTVLDNIKRKEADAERMIAEMVKFTQKILTEEIHGTIKETVEYNPQIDMVLPEWLGVAG